MPTAGEKLAVVACGVFFLAGLVTGVWKWRHMRRPPDHRAPVYVDIAHRAALLYAFAALLLGRFAALSAWPDEVDVAAVAVVVFFFASAIATYVVLGFRRDTDTQFRERTFATTWGTAALAAGEIGGFLVLFSGVLRTLFG